MRYIYDDTDRDFRDIVIQIANGLSWNSLLASGGKDNFSAYSNAPFAEDIWDQLDEIGLRGLTVPEDAGGVGATWSTLAASVEALAAAAVPVPILPQIVGLEALISPAAGLAEPEKDKLTELYLDSHAHSRPALALPTAFHNATPEFNFKVSQSETTGSTVSGVLSGAVHPGQADRLVLLASNHGIPQIVIVNSSKEFQETVSLDHSRPLINLELNAVPVDAVLATGEAAAFAWEFTMLWIEIMVAFENIGVAREALNRSTAYSTQRWQFNAPLADNQVLRHKLVDDHIAIYEADAVAHEALCTLSELGTNPLGPTQEEMNEVRLISSLAKFATSEAATKVTENMVQLHGGTGFTWESDVHILLKRAIGNRLLAGTPANHRDRIAGLANI